MKKFDTIVEGVMNEMDNEWEFKPMKKKLKFLKDKIEYWPNEFTKEMKEEIVSSGYKNVNSIYEFTLKKVISQAEEQKFVDYFGKKFGDYVAIDTFWDEDDPKIWVYLRD